MILVLSTLLVLAEVPSPPKHGIAPEMLATELSQFKAAAFELSKRVQADPDYATMDVNSSEPFATVYFKGNAVARLARYTSDPRFKALPAPLSAKELGAISRSFMLWVEGQRLEWDVAGADPRYGLVSLGTRKPETVLSAAHAQGIDLSHIRIYDSTPHYGPEIG